MNIFATSKCPVESAKYLDNKRVIKMVVESAQLLSTAMHIHGDTNAPYKKTHVNHPCTQFTAKTRENYMWVLKHFKALSDEYTLRYNKIHKSSLLFETLEQGSKSIPAGELTKFANCAANLSINVNFKHIDDVHVAYKQYLAERWKHDKRAPSWN